MLAYINCMSQLKQNRKASTYVQEACEVGSYNPGKTMAA